MFVSVFFIPTPDIVTNPPPDIPYVPTKGISSPDAVARTILVNSAEVAEIVLALKLEKSILAPIAFCITLDPFALNVIVSPSSKAVLVENVIVFVDVLIAVITVVAAGAVVPLWYINSIPVPISVKSETITVLLLTASPNGFEDIASVV